MRANLSSRELVPAASRRSWWAELTQNRIIALVLAMIVAVPLLAAPADRNLTGIAALTLESFALVLMTALLWRAKWDLRAENVRRFFATGANLPIVLLLSAMIVSCVFSPSKLFSIQELLRTGAGILLYFVVAYQFRQSKHLSLLVGVVLSLSAIVAIGGMAQYQMMSQDRASAIFGNSQPLASFVMLLLPVVASLAWTDKNPVRRNAAMIVTVLMAGCLMLTQGRSGWIGAIAGLLTLAFLMKRSATQTSASAVAPLRSRKHQLVWPVLAAVIAVGFLAITKTQNTTIDSRVIASQNLSKDDSWQSRLDSWKGTLRMIEAKPLTGWGTGVYPVYQRAFTGKGAVISPDGAGIRVSLAEQAHNYYLQTAAEIGIPGLLLTLGVFAFFLNAGLRRVQTLEPGIRRTLLMGSLAATVAFLVDAFASPSWQYGQTSMFLWLLMGVGTSCFRPRVKREEIVEVHTASRRFSLISRPMAAGLFLLLVSLLPTGYSSAQSFDYNPNNSSSDTQKIVYGTAAVAGLLYLLGTLSESVVAGAGAGAAGAGAAGAGDGAAGAGTGGGAGGVTAPAGTGGVNPDGTNLSSGSGDATNVGPNTADTSGDPLAGERGGVLRHWHLTRRHGRKVGSGSTRKAASYIHA